MDRCLISCFVCMGPCRWSATAARSQHWWRKEGVVAILSGVCCSVARASLFVQFHEAVCLDSKQDLFNDQPVLAVGSISLGSQTVVRASAACNQRRRLCLQCSACRTHPSVAAVAAEDDAGQDLTLQGHSVACALVLCANRLGYRRMHSFRPVLPALDAFYPVGFDAQPSCRATIREQC